MGQSTQHIASKPVTILGVALEAWDAWFYCIRISFAESKWLAKSKL
jgi:hypothetical protein